MALLTELNFMPSTNYRYVAPTGAFHERQGIGGVPRHIEPPSVVGVSSGAIPRDPLRSVPLFMSVHIFHCRCAGGV